MLLCSYCGEKYYCINEDLAKEDKCSEQMNKSLSKPEIKLEELFTNLAVSEKKIRKRKCICPQCFILAMYIVSKHKDDSNHNKNLDKINITDDALNKYKKNRLEKCYGKDIFDKLTIETL